MKTTAPSAIARQKTARPRRPRSSNAPIWIGAAVVCLLAIGGLFYLKAKESAESDTAAVQRLTELVLNGWKAGNTVPLSFDKSDTRLFSPSKWERVRTTPVQYSGMNRVVDTLLIDSSNKGGQPIRVTWHLTWANRPEGWTLITVTNDHGAVR
jgi:hypothetical protein